MDHRESTRNLDIETSPAVACGKRWVTRLMRLAGLEGRCKKRYRKAPTPPGR
jgi:hypothetical protein